VAAPQAIEGSVDRGGGHEGLVSLDIQDEVVARKLFIGNYFRCSLCAGLMRGGSQHGFESGLLHHRHNLLGVGRDDQPVADLELGETAGDSEDEGFPGEEPEGLVRQTAGAQPSRNHAKDGHR
jgi:hypothetical protein